MKNNDLSKTLHRQLKFEQQEPHTKQRCELKYSGRVYNRLSWKQNCDVSHNVWILFSIRDTYILFVRVSFFYLLLLFILWCLQAFHISLTILFSIYSKEGHAEMLTKIFLCNLKLIHDEVIFSPRGHKWNLITMKNNMSRTKKKILEKES
jgi:hypothetical protein